LLLIRFLFITLYLFIFASDTLFASTTSNLPSGWHLLRVSSDTYTPTSIAPSAELIYTYKNQDWYGISPNDLHTEALQTAKIEPIISLSAGDAFWVLLKERGDVVFGNEPTECSQNLVLKEGWNLTAFSCTYNYIIPEKYFTSDDISLIWSYNTYSGWKVFSPLDAYKTIINNKPDIALSLISGNSGFWVYAKKDINITISDKPPFFENDTTSYTFEEKDMEQFFLSFKDPNGNPLAITLSGTDADRFTQNGLQAQFKPINTKPKPQYIFTTTITDGRFTVTKETTININLRKENDYSGEFKNNVGKDNDEDVEKQWYLDASHLNIHEVHKTYNGSSINRPTIQIVEGGFDTTHEDLIANMDFSMAYDDTSNTEGNCLAQGLDGAHGTSSAGIIGGRGMNGIGITGIVPFGKITGYKFAKNVRGLLVTDTSTLWRAWAKGARANDIDISSNSWGGCTDNSLQKDEMLKYGSEKLRDGKGRIYVFAAGNHRVGSDTCTKNSTNLQTVLNNPYAITVAAMDKNDTIANSSNPGANVFISTYGEDIIWTTYSYSFKYASFSGTSAAAPMVAGGIGLVLEACPTLNYRDVKNIIAKTAIKVDVNNPNWVKNGANIYHSTDYGFGKLNTLGAINMCKNNYEALPAGVTFQSIASVDKDIPNNGTPLEVKISVNENKKIEWAGIYLDGKIDNIGKYEFYLKSPSGTKIKLIHGDNAAREINLNTNGFYLSNISDSEVFRLSTVGFLDEQSAGDWTVEISDKNIANTQTNKLLRNIKLEIVGH